MDNQYLITGVKGGVHRRLEIRDLEKNPEQFTLFILGWDAIRQSGYQPLAAQYVQQAGIHGLPYERWPGDPEVKAPSKHAEEEEPWLGYCNHGSVLFPAWHRPSMLLLEQSISEAASGIVQNWEEIHKRNNNGSAWEEASVWKKAVEELRFPFWDWTHPDTGTKGLPEIFYRKQLELKMPGKKERVRQENILAFYSFGPTRPDGFRDIKNKPIGADEELQAYYQTWDRTYRWPESKSDKPSEDLQELNKHLTGMTEEDRGSWHDLTTGVARLFGFPSNVKRELHANVWDEFSNTSFMSASDPDNQVSETHDWRCGSLERPHNSVHLVIGGLGHMMDNNYAAFDPIFHLHHCNVDRILAFWEHVYPDYYLGEDGYLITDDGKRKPFEQPGGKWPSGETTTVKGSTELTPFRNSNRAYWTSKETHRLGDQAFPKYYTYPPISDPNDPSNQVVIGEDVTAEQRERQRAALQKHFNHDLVKIRQAVTEVDPPKFEEFSASPDPGYEKIVNYRQFVVSVDLDPYAFGGCSYALDLTYVAGNNTGYVGSAAVLGRGGDTRCGACQGRRAAGVKSHSVILVPHEAVVKIVKHHSSKQSAEALVESLRAQISFPDGTVTRDPCESKKQEHAPKLVLHSASVQAKQEPNTKHNPHEPQDISPAMPYETYDWQEHSSLSVKWGEGQS